MSTSLGGERGSGGVGERDTCMGGGVGERDTCIIINEEVYTCIVRMILSSH